jgi:hypothetical protein
VKLAKHNRIQLVRVPGYVGIAINEVADQGSCLPFIRPDSALGISAKLPGDD